MIFSTRSSIRRSIGTRHRANYGASRKGNGLGNSAPPVPTSEGISCVAAAGPNSFFYDPKRAAAADRPSKTSPRGNAPKSPRYRPGSKCTVRKPPAYRKMTPAYSGTWASRSGKASITSPVYCPGYAAHRRHEIPSAMYSPQYTQEYISPVANSEADNFSYKSPTSPKYTPTSPTFCGEEPAAPGAYSPSYYSETTRTVSSTTSTTGNKPGVVTSSSSISSGSKASSSSSDATSSDGIKPQKPVGNFVGSRTTTKGDRSNNKMREQRGVGEEALAWQPGRNARDVDGVNRGTVKQEEGQQRLAYDPTQPQYSAAYDPDPTNLCGVFEGRASYHPCFPRYDD